MKSVTLYLQKIVELTVIVPDAMRVEELQRVAENVAADFDFDETFDLEDIEWAVELGRSDVIDTMPAPDEDGVVVLSDDGEDFVNSADATWWQSTR